MIVLNNLMSSEINNNKLTLTNIASLSSLTLDGLY